MGKYDIITVCISVCLIRDARTLNRKIEMVRRGMEHKLVSALVDIDDLRDNMGTCKCPGWNSNNKKNH